jgi:hypothetical protein
VKINIYRTAGWAVYFLSMTALLYTLFGNWGYDDPYITYRYARNLAEGRGFVYNPGELVLSTTTPLFALLLAGLSRFWSNLPQLANLISAASLASGGILLWHLGQTWKTRYGAWIMLFLYPLFPLVVTSFGSETPLYLALGLAAFLGYARRRYGLAALFAALAVLGRPDAVLIAVIFAADFLLRYWRSSRQPVADRPRESIPWGAILTFIGILGAWAVFGLLYFGSPLPVTLFAKQAQGSMAISMLFWEGFINKVILVYKNNPLYWLMLLLATVGLVFAVFRRSPWWLLLAWPLIYFVSYAVLGVSSYFWYYAPLVLGLVPLVGLGGEALALFAERLVLRNFAQQAGQVVVLLILLILVPWQVYSLYRASHFVDPRLGVYADVGFWLANNTPADAQVGLLEVGVIGYYADRAVVDFAGLIQPDVARQMTFQTTYEDTAVWAWEQYRPAYIVLHNGFFPVLEAKLLASGCQPVRTFLGQDYAYTTDLVVYACPP